MITRQAPTDVHRWSEDATVADRVRSELGPVLKALDHPHVHVSVADGIVSLHGDVADPSVRGAIESSVMTTCGVRGLSSHLHVGLLPSDSRPSEGRRHDPPNGEHTTIRHLTARDVMTRHFASVPPDASVFAAVDVIARHKVHHLPVVSADGRCLAIVDATTTFRLALDACVHGGADLYDSSAQVGPLCVLPGTLLTRVAEQMTLAATDACAVVDEHGQMLGLITARDVVAGVAGAHTSEMAE